MSEDHGDTLSFKAAQFRKLKLFDQESWHDKKDAAYELKFELEEALITARQLDVPESEIHAAIIYVLTEFGLSTIPDIDRDTYKDLKRDHASIKAAIEELEYREKQYSRKLEILNKKNTPLSFDASSDRETD